MSNVMQRDASCLREASSFFYKNQSSRYLARSINPTHAGERVLPSPLLYRTIGCPIVPRPHPRHYSRFNRASRPIRSPSFPSFPITRSSIHPPLTFFVFVSSPPIERDLCMKFRNFYLNVVTIDLYLLISLFCFSFPLSPFSPSIFTLRFHKSYDVSVYLSKTKRLVTLVR